MNSSGEGRDRDRHPVEQFLGRIRRRELLDVFRMSCLWGLAANETLKWGTLWANRLFNREIPVYLIGPYVFAVMMLKGLLNSGRFRVAGRADRKWGLKDRMISYVDFAVRSDVDDEYRAAQANEAVEATNRLDTRRGFADRLLLWVSPFLLVWMIFANYFSTYIPVRMPSYITGVPPHGDRAGNRGPDGTGLEYDGGTMPEEGMPVSDEGVPDLDRANGGSAREEMDETSAGPDPADTGAAKDKAADIATGGHPVDVENGPGANGGESAGRAIGEIVEPVRLFSRPVGEELTPTREPSNARSVEGPAVGPALPEGKIAFDLIPRGGRRPAGGLEDMDNDERLEIVVDFDSVPVEYREYVRRYFEGLGAVNDER